MYESILATIHDRGFDGLARAAAAHLREALQGRRIPRLADLGCGSGVLLEAVADLAEDRVGLDISPEMIALARARVPQARLHVGDLLDTPLPDTDAITCVGEILSYASAGPGFRDTDLRAFLARLHHALRPGGLLLFDVLGSGHDYTGTVFRDAEDWAVASTTRLQEGLVERHIVAFLQDGDHYRKSVEVHRLRTFPAETLEAALAEAGFEARRIPAYAGQPLAPGRLAYEARRP